MLPGEDTGGVFEVERLRDRLRFVLHVANEETIPAILTVRHAGQEDRPKRDAGGCQNVDVIDGIEGVEAGLCGFVPNVIPFRIVAAVAPKSRRQIS
jgi:hypothetical protein